ncbi:MAG TPA: SUMF1/EgtB/PvdO family nonheme iron enzyme [Bryobacteraceae bacterium]|nr:SUMF1/EgtB/PvdO family nonheme iron enzyme [Bryobacteraceae bacterium]
MAPTTELSQALSQARARTDSLFDLVKPDALYDRPIPERNRIIFYLGHLEAFDWNLLAPVLDKPAFHPGFDRLFSFGIDPDSTDLPTDQPADWPAEAEVRDYNAEVRRQLDKAIAHAPAQLMHVAVEHRLMHAETFAYMLHHLPFDRKAHEHFVTKSGAPPQSRMVEIAAGSVTLGRRRNDGFGWDNEFDQHQVDVPAFAISQHKVTNGEYLEFVNQGASAPHFWTCRAGEWFYHGMFADIRLPLDWPVYVTQEQAQTYARWKGASLPTEAQFHRAAYHGAHDHFAGENVDFQGWDPVPVTASSPNRWGVAQMVGNGWEWTSTLFEPFAGFQPFSFYPGYSANFFDRQHYVLKGGSPLTARRLLRDSFRNWFRPAYPYVYATFRLVEN